MTRKMPDWLVPIGAAVLLILVSSLPARLSGRASPILVTALVCFGLTAGLTGEGLTRSGFVQRSTGPRVVRHADRRLKRALRRDTKNLLIIDGGSASARAVDPQVIEQQLRKRGYSAAVVQLTLTGANHFERFAMHQWLLRLADERARQDWKEAHTILLTEIHSGYDRIPLAQLDRNTGTDRAYFYLFPSNALWAWKASRLEDGNIVETDEWFEWLLLRHSLYVGLNVGAVSRLVPFEALKPRSGYSKLRRPSKRFKFRGIEPVLSRLDEPSQSGEAPHKRWLESIRDPRLRSAYQDKVDHFAFHALPHLSSRVRYDRAFCAATDEPCLLVSKPLFTKLDKRSMWYNRGHLTQRGAKIYSTWLANQLIAQNLLER